MGWRGKYRLYVLCMAFSIAKWCPPICQLAHQEESDPSRLDNDLWKCNTPRYESCWPSLRKNVTQTLTYVHRWNKGGTLSIVNSLVVGSNKQLYKEKLWKYYRFSCSLHFLCFICIICPLRSKCIVALAIRNSIRIIIPWRCHVKHACLCYWSGIMGDLHQGGDDTMREDLKNLHE